MKATVTLVLTFLIFECQVNGGAIPNFKQHHVYVYDYEGQVGTGISENDVKHFSGFGIKSKLKMFTQNDKIYFQFNETKMANVNTDVDDFFAPLDIPYAEPTTQEDKDAVMEMEKLFAAIYEDGVFKSFYDPGDRFTDWRRSIVSLFQTQFHPNVEKGSQFYKVDEDGVGGKCKTLYEINHLPSEETQVEDVMNVTKVRLYDECKHRPHYFFSSMIGEKCGRCKQELTKQLKTLGRVEYQIKGTKQQFTIEKLFSTGVIAFTPFTTNGQTVLSIVNQTFSLVSEEDVGPFEVPADVEQYKQVDSLSFQFYPETVGDIQAIENFHHNRVYKKATFHNVETLEPLLKSLVKAHKQGTKESGIIMRIIYWLGEFVYEHFEELFEKRVQFTSTATKEENTTMSLLRYTLLEILPAIGTKASVKYLLHLIEERKVDRGTASDMLSRFPFYVKDFAWDILEAMETFVNKEEVKDYLQTSNSGILAFGVLVRRACVQDELHPRTNGNYYRKNLELCKKYVKGLKDQFYQVSSSNGKDAIVYLEALLSTHHPDSYQVFIDVVKNDTYPVLLRRTAIRGVELFADEKPEEIAALIAPLYFDRKNDYPLRIYAFKTLINSFGTSEFFSNLVISLKKEPNNKVSNYVFAYLETVANTTDPCYESVSENARFVLQYAKPRDDYDIIRHGSQRILSAYNARYNFGSSLKISYIPSEHSLIPRDISVTQNFNILGYDFEIFEVGLISDEDNELVAYSEYFAPQAIQSDPDRKQTSAIKDIISELGLGETRKHDVDGRFGLYTKMFGHVVKYTDKLNIDEFADIIFKGNKLEYNIHSVSYTEVEYMIPNEMGSTVVLSVKVPSTAHLVGSAALQLNPFEGITGNVEFDANFRTEFFVNARMFVYTSTFSKSGYQVQTTGGLQLPIKGSLDIDTHAKKFALNYVPPTKPFEIFHYDTDPMSIAPLRPRFVSVNYSQYPIMNEYKFGHDYFGVGFTTNFESNYMWNDYGSYWEFLNSFFHKETRHEDYFLLADKLYAGTEGFLDYAFLNPSAKPFQLGVTFEPSETNPTTEFVLTNKYNQTTYFDQDGGQEICQGSISIVGRGPVERTWDVKFSSSATFPIGDFRKVLLHYERSPIPNYDSKKFELHFKSDITYVNYTTIFSEKPDEVAVIYNGKLTIGNEDGENATEIRVKMLADQTEEHKTADKTNVWYYKKCKEEKENKALFTDACWRVMKDSARIDKIAIDFEYKNIYPEFKAFAERLNAWFSHSLYNNLYVDYSNGNREENHMNVVANFSYYYPVFDVKITRPDQTLYYNKVYAPSIFPKYEPFNVAENGYELYARKFFNYHTPRCYVNGDRVHTFDGLDYSFNEEDSKCYHLMMGDCKSHNFFAFIKKVDSLNMDKALKLYFHDDIIEVVPNAKDDKLDLLFNGEKKNIIPGFIFPVTGHTSYKLNVAYWGKNVYIQAKDYGMDVYFDGSTISLTTTYAYRSKQCGLCGDLDGETYHDLKSRYGTTISSKEMNRLYQYNESSNAC